jgi:hypothetical protein
MKIRTGIAATGVAALVLTGSGAVAASSAFAARTPHDPCHSGGCFNPDPAPPESAECTAATAALKAAQDKQSADLMAFQLAQSNLLNGIYTVQNLDNFYSYGWDIGYDRTDVSVAQGVKDRACSNRVVTVSPPPGGGGSTTPS